MASIFISYARDDATFAARLREGIEARGFSAWMDTVSIVLWIGFYQAASFLSPFTN